jgi:hypothetical protein
MTPATCSHGLVQQNKFGLEQRDGLDICRGCGLPTAESYLKTRTAQAMPHTERDKARAARATGAPFFEIQLVVGESAQEVSIVGGDSGHRTERDHGTLLGEIEAEGWHLQHVGYVFVPTSQSTRTKMLGTGEQVGISGVTVGIYLFRNTDHASELSSL